MVFSEEQRVTTGCYAATHRNAAAVKKCSKMNSIIVWARAQLESLKELKRVQSTTPEGCVLR